MAFNRGCAETAGLFSFGCQQQTPTPLPDIPATGVMFSFGPDGLFPEGQAGTVDEGLNLLNQYLACFPQNICGAAEDGDILQHNGTDFQLINFDDLIGGFLEDLIPNDGEVLYNDNGTVAGSDLCDLVADCVAGFITSDGEVLTTQGGNLVSTDFSQLLEDALDDLLDPGEVLMNDSGNITGADLCDQVFDCLSSTLGSGQIPLGGAPGGVGVLCDEVENCLGNLLGNGDVLVGGTSGPVATDLCTAVINCFDTAFNTNNGQILYDAGGGLAPADLCTLVADCLTNGGVLTGTNTYFGTDATGAVGEIDFCTSVQDCLAGLATPAGNNTYFGVDGTGALGFFDLCAAVAACVAALPVNGDPGDMQVINAGGTEEYRTFLEYMNEFYPQTTCDTYLYFDANAGVWTFRSGVEPLPPNPATDLAPIIPPVNAKGIWEFDKETGCSSLVCSPRQKDITIQVPGDFPTLQDAANWLRAKTVENVVINLTAADPGATFDQVNGRVIINGNNNQVAGISLTTSTANLTLNDMALAGSAGNGLFVAGGGYVNGNNVSFDSNAQNGIYATVGSKVFITGVLSASGNGANGIFSDDGSTVNLGGSIPASNNGNTGVYVTAGSHVGIDGNIQAASNTVDGYYIDQGSTFESTGDASGINNGRLGIAMFTNATASFPSGTFDGNTSSGIAVNASVLGFGTALVAQGNGGNGAILANQATLHSGGGAVAFNNNAANGMQLTGSSNVRVANLYTNTNGGTGVYLAESSSVLALGEVQSGFNGQMGVWALRNSTFSDYGGVGIYNANGNVGVYTQDDSHAYVVNATADGNAGSAFYAQDGSHIMAIGSTATNSGAGFGYTALTMSRVHRGASTASGNALGPNNIPLNVTSIDGSFII